MDRREFLKIGSLGSAALLVQIKKIPLKLLNRPVLIEHQGTIYRGTQEGEILASHDLGKTWQMHLYMGKGYSVMALSKDAWKRLHARVNYAGRDFELTLAAGNKHWLSIL